MSARRGVVFSLGALAALGILAALVGSRLDDVRRVGESVSWAWAFAALGCAFASYAMAGMALSETLSVLGHDVGGPSVLGIALVSTTANYVVSAGGVTGFALKAHLLHKRHVPIATTITASAVTSAILYAVLALILGQGFVSLLLHASGARVAILESAFGLVLLLALSGLILLAFFNRSVRGRLSRRLFRWTNRAAYSLSSREIPREDFAQFEMQLTQGLARIRAGKGRLTMTVLYTCLDWGFAMISLWLCFRAVGVLLPLGHLSAAFTTGQAATLIPILPGGLGAAEGSIAALMGGLGVDVGRALVAAMLFRLAYYVAPSLLAVLVLWGLKVSEPAVLSDAANLDLGLSPRADRRS
ncbi:MAG TPA: flippase-like domain-containing protein [Elusimicrobiota bacterium]|nr:flippase-like domain-containing protein [Elusimicrobiota bacterium]